MSRKGDLRVGLRPKKYLLDLTIAKLSCGRSMRGETFAARQPPLLGVFMTNPSRLLKAYERMMSAQEEKHRLIPERLMTLVADEPWIRAVSKHSQARQAFLEAAIDFCRSKQFNAGKRLSSTDQKRAVKKRSQEVHLP